MSAHRLDVLDVVRLIPDLFVRERIKYAMVLIIYKPVEEGVSSSHRAESVLFWFLPTVEYSHSLGCSRTSAL